MRLLALVALLLVLPSSMSSAAPDYLRSLRPITSDGAPVCTAFSIAPTVWLTASHCIKDGNRLAQEEYQVLKIDPKVDLALVKTTEEIAPGLPLAPEPPEIGDAFVGAGFALELPYPTLWQGLVSNPSAPTPPDAPRNWERVMVTFGPSSMGHSGSPLLNDKRQVIGVAVGSGHPASLWQSVGLAIPLPLIKKFLGRK